MFGTAVQYIKFVDCDYEEECREKGVVAYPTWSDGEKLLTPGILSLNKLAQLSSCKY